MLLDEFEPELLGKQHEPVHRPLGLVLVLCRRLLLLGGRHGRRHDHLLRGQRPRVDHRRGRGRRQQRRVLLVKLKAPEPVAEIGGARADGLRVVGRETDVADRQVLARDAVLVDRQPGLGGAPACGRERESINC